eukprot:TRINITY_DN643_c0_g1_i5.p1 TRINITY_DN643_c0_g1~~TRINITY_DN643_c0_g1_i5.p1  ORF type:complete len:576 (-),score=71.70 TRINITY_DN643_c0_g1_i5:92-1819(-)
MTISKSLLFIFISFSVFNFCGCLVSLDAQGYFVNDGVRFFPVGLNYWAGSTGVEMWSVWPAMEISDDLEVLKSLGFNTVRFFLRWDVFEPDFGVYNQTVIARLEQMLTWCRSRGLFVNISVFVGWMSGGTFWPSWKGNRNLFTDPIISSESFLFARKVSAVAAPFSSIILAMEYGNEMDVLQDSKYSETEQIAAWCTQIRAAFRSSLPNVLVISGTDHDTVITNPVWNLGKIPADIFSVHGYPVPTWNNLLTDGLTDPLTQSLLPFYTAFVKTFSPVMLQEFGTIVTGGAKQQDQYIRGMLLACWEEGANGFLYWDMRDIKTLAYPYLNHGLESLLGLVLDDNTIKPGLEYFVQFARNASSLAIPKLPPLSETIGLYIPAYYYQNELFNPGNEPRRISANLLIDYYLLKRVLGRNVRLIRGDLPLDPSLEFLIIAGSYPTLPEILNLQAWVRGGGKLIWNGPDMSGWSSTTIDLIGAKPVDFRFGVSTSVALFGKSWTFDTFVGNGKLQYEQTTGQVVASDNYGIPVVFKNKFGKGDVVFCSLPVEDNIVAISAYISTRNSWAAWYSGILNLFSS